ncbi:MAG: A/G-specific adenine glycosylase [Candidatus Liptonbacteria bacterium]|nr:A/G-specific adenine glycosylase [Candidatus Liptonbacteria bacterium]
MAKSEEQVAQFRRIVRNYYRAHGRDFPWRRTRNPYAIAVSEIMLQQTQVERVRGKYGEFLKAFPNFRALANASPASVLRVWQGLGYNRRALALHRVSKIVMEEYCGKLPCTPEALETLPGVGPATAGSIAAFAFNAPATFIETNIRRAILHHFFPRRRNVPEEEVVAIAAEALDRKKPREWYWALMDYGSMLGKSVLNPNRRSAEYRRQSPFRGSDRELRGRVVRLLAEKSRVAVLSFVAFTGESGERMDKVFRALEREGFLRRKGGEVMIVE